MKSMKSGVLIFFLVLSWFSGTTQALRTRNVILVTLDGFRWQELFQGADSLILFNKEFMKHKGAADQFWDPSAVVRREKLMPFVWNVIGNQGQLYGNRIYGNQVDCSNPFRFSSPGYSEMLVGFVDRRVNSNHVASPNTTVLEYISRQQGYQDRVAVFSSWEGISLVAQPQESSIQISAGRVMASGEISEREKLLNDLQQVMPERGARPDALTFYYAFEYLKRARPRVLFISFDETDDFAHKGKYDEYLTAAHQNDDMIRKLWEWIQSQEDYRDQTTLLITTDHGRGKGARQAWKSHNSMTTGSGQVWMLAIGPDTPSSGEMKTEAQYFQKQVAGTLAAFLGLDYSNRHRVGEVIHSMIRSEMLSDNIFPARYVPSVHK